MTGIPESGMELLAYEDVKKEMDRQRELIKSQVCADDVLRRVAELAFGRANDCVRLALEDGVCIDELDLSLLSEVKRGSNGVVEIKLTDRMKALERMWDLIAGQSVEAEDFFKTLDDMDAEQ